MISFHFLVKNVTSVLDLNRMKYLPYDVTPQSINQSINTLINQNVQVKYVGYLSANGITTNFHQWNLNMSA